MKRLLAALSLSAISFSLYSQDSKAYFLSNPTLSPDGQTVVFSFEGDLWKANISDGQASRLTAMQGYETSPAFLPMENGSPFQAGSMAMPTCMLCRSMGER